MYFIYFNIPNTSIHIICVYRDVCVCVCFHSYIYNFQIGSAGNC